VLFCDVVGSTALGESVDPEALQGLLAGYFERMKGIVESHGCPLRDSRITKRHSGNGGFLFSQLDTNVTQ